MMNASLRNLQTASSELARLQNQASSRKAIGVPSDDPAGTADALRVRSAIKSNDQYARNVNDGNGWLTAADSALTGVSELLRKARDLTVQGANDGALSIEAKEGIAAELVTIRDALRAQANTNYLGRNVFAGTSDAEAAFAADYSYSGGLGSVDRRIGDGTTVRVDVDGAAAFGTGTQSMFAELDAIVADLRSGVNVSSHLAVLDTRRDSVLSALATVGARQSMVFDAQETNLSRSVELEAQRSGIEDVVLEKIVLELSLQEVTYKAALSVTARTLQQTLMDFIR
ncbi:flagellar hook-associated protein 3 FlgL [Leifsonia psychrotolerans]|uniref:Flagellar hook-associated protein 3 FlgL n=2 Tax=Glaciibacter psychrotolerans TaxID=670054 RepID=A0A7Z0EC85_9MICO|nr:flagellar hook-associated protein 3 FlgL [Leifsonia psychrotolerans]